MNPILYNTLLLYKHCHNSFLSVIFVYKPTREPVKRSESLVFTWKPSQALQRPDSKLSFGNNTYNFASVTFKMNHPVY